MSALIPTPERPRLPLRVPVEADLGGASVKAEVLGSTSNVLLVQGPENEKLPGLGTQVRIRLEWDRQLLTGRLAAYGVAGRFLVTLGERAIRRSRRFNVDLAGTARTVADSTDVRITDLSSGGARIEGIDVPVGTEIELRFTPPGRTAPTNVLGFVVRSIDNAEVPSLGVAFRLVQPSMDALAA